MGSISFFLSRVLDDDSFVFIAVVRVFFLYAAISNGVAMLFRRRQNWKMGGEGTQKYW